MDAIAILAEVAAKHETTVSAIRGRSKPRGNGGSMLQARREAAQRLTHERKLSRRQVGNLLGGRHRTTILAYIRDGYMERKLEKLRRIREV